MTTKKPNKIRIKYINPLFWITYLLIIIYRFLSKPFPSRCRFHPTCSTYALEVLQTFGYIKAILFIVIRIFKCNPFHPGGLDYVKADK